jgi:hypothetical protein
MKEGRIVKCRQRRHTKADSSAVIGPALIHDALFQHLKGFIELSPNSIETSTT